MVETFQGIVRLMLASKSNKIDNLLPSPKIWMTSEHAAGCLLGRDKEIKHRCG